MATNQSPAVLARTASEKDLSVVAQSLGMNWEILGLYLLKGNAMATIEHIKHDHFPTVMRIYSLLLTWKQQASPDTTLGHLFHQMLQVGTSVTVEWRTIAKYLHIEEREIRACKHGYQPPVQPPVQESSTNQIHDTDMQHMTQWPIQATQEIDGRHVLEEAMEGVEEQGYNDVQTAVDGHQTSGPSLSDRRNSKAYRPPKDACIFDGRLIKLGEKDIADLEKNCKIQIGEGAFGKVFTSKSVSDGFGMHVAVKKIPFGKPDAHTRSIRREMITSRIMHPFILPLLAVVDLTNRKPKPEFWFVSPYCKKGDLQEAIKDDQGNVKMNEMKRIRILLHIALAIQYIHTKMPDVRDVIIHKGISSKNVVLDDAYNARLIDFGLAREKDDKTTNATGRMYYSHPDFGQGKPVTESWDYYMFAVIIREMLTGLGPQGNNNKFLKNMEATEVLQKLEKRVWVTTDRAWYLNDIAEKCLKPNAWTVSAFYTTVVEKINKIWKDFGQKKIMDVTTDHAKCHVCMINPKAREMLTEEHASNCSQKIEICIACENNLSLNPIACYCGIELQPKIGNLPREILRMDSHSIALYKEALQEGKVSVHNIRVMVVGHYGVGKTTLTKRLLGELVDTTNRQSTNGIDVHKNKYKILKDGTWIQAENDEAPRRNFSQLAGLFKTRGRQKPEYEAESLQEYESRMKSGSADGINLLKNDSSPEGVQQEVGHEVETFPDKKSNTKSGNASETRSEVSTSNRQQSDSGKGEPVNNADVNYWKHFKKLIKYAKEDHSGTSILSVWDFAGQKVFYTTHQVFLSPRAIYLLVLDMSKLIDDIVQDDDSWGDSSTEEGNRKISDLITFWLDSISEFCGSEEGSGPPVVLVGTFADELKKQGKDASTFFNSLRLFLAQKSGNCLVTEKDFGIDNSVVDKNISSLKKHIFDVASKQYYWGEDIPAKWVTLEDILTGMKEEKMILKERLRAFNKDLLAPIESDEELDLFLQFQHEIGNIIHFSEEELDQYILLEPQWLIDAFKSVITADEFIPKDKFTLREWKDFKQTAVLQNALINKLWNQEGHKGFMNNKNVLLKFMERLGLVAKLKQVPKTSSSEMPGGYFVPYMLKRDPPPELKSCCDSDRCKYTSKLCYTSRKKLSRSCEKGESERCLPEEPSRILQGIIFIKVLAMCLQRWQLLEKGGQYRICRSGAVFKLEGNHRLHIFIYDQVIQIWISRLSSEGKIPQNDLCVATKYQIEDILTKAIGIYMQRKLKVFVKCQKSKLHSNDDMKPLEENFEEFECSCTEEGHVVAYNDLTQYWLSGDEDSFAKKKEEKKLRSPRDPCMFDGRPIKLGKRDINDLRERRDPIPFAVGGFGKVYRCESDLFDRPVVIKTISIMDDKNLRASANREMMVARIRHQFILPLLATFCQDGERWFISPYCEKGDLAKAIKECSSEMSKALRIQVLFQLAKAIEYLHTPVKNVRDAIIHKDIASSNIVLDAKYNVRLIDFGIAREKNDETNSIPGKDAYTHPKVGTLPACEEWDIFSFGVVVRELLTGLEPTGINGKYLKKMEEQDIKRYLQTPFGDDETSETLNKMSCACLDTDETDKKNGLETDKTDKKICLETDKKINFKKEVVDVLDRSLRDCGVKDDMDPDKCHLCMINPKGRQNSRQNHICINVCISCEKNSFLNPIRCHCGNEIKSIIGNDWGALLIAGDDETFKNDAVILKNVITSKAPLIMGISGEKVQTVTPDKQESLNKSQITTEAEPSDKQDSPPSTSSEIVETEVPDKLESPLSISSEMIQVEVLDKQEYPFSMSSKMIQAEVPVKKSPYIYSKILQAIQKLPTDLHTLIIYVTCHGKNEDTFIFELSNSDKITLQEFEELLAYCKESIERLTKVVLLFDCCHPPKINLKGIDKKKVIQINACESDQSAYSTAEGSRFTKCLIQGLKAQAEGIPCGQTDCKSCENYWKERTDYVTVEKLFVYISEHIGDNRNPQLSFSGNHEDFKIAFYTDERVLIEFTLINSYDTAEDKQGTSIEKQGTVEEENTTLELEYFKNMEQIKTQLFEKFGKDKDAFSVVIKGRTFRTDTEFVECETPEKVILAWTNRQPLYVDFKPKCAAK